LSDQITYNNQYFLYNTVLNPANVFFFSFDSPEITVLQIPFSSEKKKETTMIKEETTMVKSCEAAAIQQYGESQNEEVEEQEKEEVAIGEWFDEEYIYEEMKRVKDDQKKRCVEEKEKEKKKELMKRWVEEKHKKEVMIQWVEEKVKTELMKRWVEEKSRKESIEELEAAKWQLQLIHVRADARKRNRTPATLQSQKQHRATLVRSEKIRKRKNREAQDGHIASLIEEQTEERRMKQQEAEKEFTRTRNEEQKERIRTARRASRRRHTASLTEEETERKRIKQQEMVIEDRNNVQRSQRIAQHPGKTNQKSAVSVPQHIYDLTSETDSEENDGETEEQHFDEWLDESNIYI